MIPDHNLRPDGDVEYNSYPLPLPYIAYYAASGFATLGSEVATDEVVITGTDGKHYNYIGPKKSGVLARLVRTLVYSTGVVPKP